MLYAFDLPSNTVPHIHWTEILTIIIVSTMLVEEIRQVSVLFYNVVVSNSSILLISFFSKTINRFTANYALILT